MDPVCHRRTTLLAESSARFVQLRNSSVGRSLNVEQNSRPEHPSRHWSSTRSTSSNERLSTQHQAVTLHVPRYHQHVLNNVHVHEQHINTENYSSLPLATGENPVADKSGRTFLKARNTDSHYNTVWKL